MARKEIPVVTVGAANEGVDTTGLSVVGLTETVLQTGIRKHFYLVQKT